MNGGEEEESKEEREQELQLLYAIITALGLAWPTTRDTQVREGGGGACTMYIRSVTSVKYF